MSPTGEATLGHVVPLGRAETLSLFGAATLGMVYVPVLVALDPLVGASVSATWAVPHYALAATAGTTATLPGDPDRGSARTFSASVVGTYMPVVEVAVEAGGRAFVQDFGVRDGTTGGPPAEVGAAPEPQWALFAAVRFAFPLSRF
jgi:hypothetical protein